MKEKFFATVCFLLLFAMTGIAQTTKTYKIEINRDEIKRHEYNGGIYLESKDYRTPYEGPAILWGEINILLPDQEKLKSFSFEIGDSIIEEGIVLANIYYILMNTADSENGNALGYEIKDYPFVINHNEFDIGLGYRSVYINYTPFAYNAITQELRWATDISFTIETEPVEEWEYNTCVNFEDFIHRFVNYEDYWKEKKMPSIVGSVWSYINYETNTEGEEEYDFFRYTVLDEPKEMNGHTYYPMVKYTTCEYDSDKEELRAYLREEGCRIYQYIEEEERDTMLYNFAIRPFGFLCGSDYEFFQVVNGDTLCIDEHGSVFTAEDGHPFRRMVIKRNKLPKHQYHEWIDGIGNIRDFFYEYNPDVSQLTTGKGTLLNYYRSGDGRVVYKNPFKVTDYYKGYNYTGYKTDDCALGAEAVEETLQEKSTVHLQTIGSTLFCTSPNAVKLDVYTMDALKVGEASFINGEAVVKVNKTPATYLYIVTYPDGRRESGKVMVK